LTLRKGASEKGEVYPVLVSWKVMDMAPKLHAFRNSE